MSNKKLSNKVPYSTLRKGVVSNCFSKGDRVVNSVRGHGTIICIISNKQGVEYGADVKFDNGLTSGMFLRELRLLKNYY